MSRPTVGCSLVLLGLLFSAVTANSQTPVRADEKTVRGVVIVVDGSGELRPMGKDVQQAIAEAGLPLEVLPFSWSHGAGRIFSDIRGQAHHRTMGKELAGNILARRQSNPEGKIYLVCHSAGAAVVLFAADSLPPKAVDRIVLLAPFVSSGYDLRPALRSSREGIDCFYSSADIISRTAALVGTTDGRWQAAAGSVGFTQVSDGNGPDGLYQNLRQHPWSSAMRQGSPSGSHFGWAQPAFLSGYLVPLLESSRGESPMILSK